MFVETMLHPGIRDCPNVTYVTSVRHPIARILSHSAFERIPMEEIDKILKGAMVVPVPGSVQAEQRAEPAAGSTRSLPHTHTGGDGPENTNPNSPARSFFRQVRATTF